MKIALISDTHDNCDNIREAVRIANREQCELLLHCGDIVSPFAVFHLGKFLGEVRAIFGNNDGEILGLERSFVKIGGEISPPPLQLRLAGRSVLMLHDPLFLKELSQSQNYDFIFYGHLHHEDHRIVGKTLIMSPGDGSGWMKPPAFYTLELESGNYQRFPLAGAARGSKSNQEE
jgi:hypothetical protein